VTYRSTLNTEEADYAHREPEPNTWHQAGGHYKKEVYCALVVAGLDGKVLYQLSPHDGREFKSPSALGTAVTGKACNGWIFWSVAPDEAQTVETGAVPLETTEASPEEPGEADSQATSTYSAVGTEFAQPTDQPRFHKVPNQKNVDPGQVRLHCYTCRSSFIVPQDWNPDTCPMGHEPI
jgi:hypothetical protein